MKLDGPGWESEWLLAARARHRTDRPVPRVLVLVEVAEIAMLALLLFAGRYW